MYIDGLAKGNVYLHCCSVKSHIYLLLQGLGVEKGNGLY